MFSDMEHATLSSSPSPIAQMSSDTGPNATNDLGSNMLLSLMRYKAWADAELIKAVLAIPDFVTKTEGGYATAIIRHYHTVDCIFRAHLLGIPHGYTSANPSDPATLSELQPRVAAVDDWYVEYARNLSERELAEALDLTFTDAQQQVLTRGDILTHISQHGAGHRGQVSLLFRLIGAEPAPDRFTSYLRTCPSASLRRL
jgi:uncharacterized damage-inducible protein DinB